jgi:hypothetical protein
MGPDSVEWVSRVHVQSARSGIETGLSIGTEFRATIPSTHGDMPTKSPYFIKPHSHGYCIL